MSEQFIKDALRTKSDGFYTDIPIDYLISDLSIFNVYGQKLDDYKKHIFYNKKSETTEFDGYGTYVDLKKIDKVVSVDTIHGILGIATEATELTEALEHSIDTYTPIDKINIKEEIGDLFWYVALLANDLGFSFEEIQDTVIAKLKSRYPDKFTEENAINRDLVEERKILEL